MRGLADDDTSSIFINSEFPVDTVITTLYHELTHAWLTNLSGAKGEDDNMVQEEAAANLVSTGIVELLTHNELLLDWISKHVPEESERE
jgi:Zn-dependent peptidase ImmA (M78 family)